MIESPPSVQFRNFAMARSINRITNQQTFCRILNYQAEPIVLRRGKIIGVIEPVDCLV